MKYNTSISHGIEFNLGNGRYHSLGFSILKDNLNVFLNKEPLFLYLSQYIRFNNLNINFQRKKQHMFSHNHKELYRKRKFLDETNNGFSLIKSRRHTQRENVGISMYVTNICGTYNLDSTFYVNVPEHDRDVHLLQEVFAEQRLKEIHNIEESKRIAYNPCDVFKFDSVRLKDQYENKYPTVLNEDLAIDRNEINIFTNKFEKMLNHNRPQISKNQLIFTGTNKTKLNKLLTESFINMNSPQIFRMDSIRTSLRNKSLHYDKINYLVDNNVPNISINSNLLIKNGLSNNMHINNEWSMVENDFTELHYIQAYVGLDVDLGSKKIMNNDYIEAKTSHSGINYVDNGISLGSGNFKINYDENIVRSKLSSSRLNINNLSFLGNTSEKDIKINKYFLSVNKYYHDIFNINYVNLSKPHRNLTENKDNKFLFRKSKNIFKSSDLISMLKDNYQIYSDYYMSFKRQKIETTIHNTNKSAKKISRKVKVYDDIVRLNYAYKRPVYIIKNINVNLYDKGTDIYDVGILLGKGDAGIRMDDVFTVYKGGIAGRTDELNINLSKSPEGIEINDYYKALDKYPKGITEEYGLLFINKDLEGILINENIFDINKNSKPGFLIYDYIRVCKNAHGSSLNYDYIWIDKNGHGSFVIYDYAWISKNKHDSFMNYDCALISKGSHNALITSDNEFIKKSMKDIQINHYILNVEKDSKAIYMNKNVELNKFPREIRFDDSITAADKNHKGIVTENYFFIRHDSISANTEADGIGGAYHDSKEARVLEIKFVDIDRKAIEVFKEITAKEYNKDVIIQKEMNLEEASKKTWVNNYHKYFDVKKEAGRTSIRDNIRLSSPIIDANLDYQGENLSKRKKGTYIPDQYKFVDVMHHDPDPDIQPLKKSGKIDELILPHKDYTYSDFIKNLINDDGSINWKYVKSYDAETSEYIVSIPVENPITIYADIGRDYIDVDVAILKIVINLVKKVWKDNMYKYIALSAQDSLKHLMMEIDRLLIAYDLNSEDRKEAVRCMQLFRWYAEMAVLNNCEYILKFDTKKISVDYYNKDLGDFKDIITFDNMEISDNYIIEPIDETKESAITFKNNNINPGPPLNLSFRLYNINTLSSISIIDADNIENTKVYEQGIHDIKVELKNKAIVKYAPKDKYQSINIANVMIDNKSIRGFTVKYKGRFGETNIVMQNLLKSMLVVGEASEELKQKLSDVSPVTVAISTMVNYFKLHHENKLKGKRLIIKK